jgi:hypothetical protein
MTDKRLCCFESGHEGGHNFVPGFSAASIPDSCLAEEPVEPHPLEARVRELEADQLVAADVLKENMLAWRDENRKLREALFEARRKATDVVDEYVRYREQNDPQVNSGQVRLWGACRVRDAISAIIDAALATKEPA